MINRRHIRIKVMQSVYAILQSNSDNLVKEEKFLLASIDRMYDLYALSLSILIHVQDMANSHLEIAKKKYLASSEEKNPNTKFTENQVINLLKESYSFQQYLEDKKLNNWKQDDEFVRIVWDLIKESDEYSRYVSTRTSNFEEDKNFVLFIFKNIIAPNDKLADYFEDQSISWVDDIPFVNTWVVKTLNGLSATKPFKIGDLYKDESDQKFVLDLFRKVVLNHEKFDEDINAKTPNWDADRIADIDLILMKMALVEFLNFPSIPTRVSINEYIEISKDYSSQKSSFFINGVLDKILKEYTEEKRIKKIGRGLL
ncbi:transcription antitermination factor NusB [Urechidicola vernalis]|uniref:Transcription antitermination factor NusB n=1 Tax=Urechidicola vernalis TaxID=3075600 RepID=A0ABU2Y849_9FLAO|nr:transcription antitermination factor NusB [Urechidicola sp. P050]MDT0553892.1 transcription antitermination factor NusB [Urechidicola sp. P050]